MAIIAKAENKNFVPCPAGLQHAVCCDVVDQGVIESVYQGKTRKQHKVQLRWLTEEIDPDRNQAYLVTRRYTLSLDKKASLRKDLESWRGKPFTDQQLLGFDLELLIGVNCQLAVIHNERDGETYANVSTIVPLGKGMHNIPVPSDYIRVIDREEKNESIAKVGPGTGGGWDDPGPEEDEGPPF